MNRKIKNQNGKTPTRLIVIGVIIGIIILLLVWVLSGPQGGVRFANDMEEYALTYLEKNNILRGGEKIIAFYDLTTGLNATKAAIVTNERIIFYNSRATTEIPLTEIKDIKYRKEEGALTNDVIEVYGQDGTIIKIEIISFDSGESFYNALKNAVEIN